MNGFWLISITIRIYKYLTNMGTCRYNELEDPGYNADLDTKNFMVCFVCGLLGKLFTNFSF